MPDTFYRDLRECLAQAKACLEDQQLWGLSTLYLPESQTTEPPCAVGAGPHCHLDGAACGAETLEDIRREMAGCTRCPLCKGRSNIVFGTGNPEADIVFVGEAPGREEDLQGEPFVGEAGRLLDRMLFAMGLERSRVYICNLEKCRPPQNRDPAPEEIAACEPFLKRQLAAISPRIIVALGRVSAQALLGVDTPIGRLRGHWHSYEGIPLLPTFHPAYLLRNPAAKQDAWEDLKLVMKRLRELKS